MATTELSPEKKLAQMQRLTLFLNDPNEAVRQQAIRRLGELGFAVTPTPNGFSVTEKASPIAGSTKPTPMGREREAGSQGSGARSLDYSAQQDIRDLLARPPSDSPAFAAPVSGGATSAAPAATAPGAGRSAYSMGAPSLDDRIDTTGHFIPGAQTFVRGIFAGAENAQKALEAYRKAHFGSLNENDPQLKALEQAANAASADVSAATKWAAMSPSARQSVLSKGERAAGLTRATNTSQAFAAEQAQARADQGANPTNLLQDLDYYNRTGVMRGGAGVGTSTTQAGGVISAPDKTGARTLRSPYGSGGVTYLTPEQQATRPEATIEGMPASQFFDKAAMRQGTSFDVGGNHYSPELSPADYAQKQLEDKKRQAEEERKKFAASLLKR